jgi:hypothetical protein
LWVETYAQARLRARRETLDCPADAAVLDFWMSRIESTA